MDVRYEHSGARPGPGVHRGTRSTQGPGSGIRREERPEEPGPGGDLKGGHGENLYPAQYSRQRFSTPPLFHGRACVSKPESGIANGPFRFSLASVVERFLGAATLFSGVELFANIVRGFQKKLHEKNDEKSWLPHSPGRKGARQHTD